MTANPLVAAPVDTASPFSGTFLLEDGAQFVSAVESRDWVSGGMALFAGAMDTVAAVSDPLGTLFAMGLGWVLDHVEPLKGWLNNLTGNAGDVAAFAATWQNIERQMSTCRDTYAGYVNRDVADMSGTAIDAYRRFGADVAEHLGAAGQWSAAMATALEVCSSLVQIVHDVVRDAIAQVAGAICSYAVELVVTLGAATPLIIEQATTRAAALTTRVSAYIDNLLSSFRSLRGLLDDLGALLRRFKKAFDDVPKGKSKALDDGPAPAGKKPPTASPLDEFQIGSVAEDLVSDSNFIKSSESSGRTTLQYDRAGGFEQAQADFARLAEGLGVTTYPNGTSVITLSNGTKVNVREHSSGGRPTLEIVTPGNPTMKFRY